MQCPHCDGNISRTDKFCRYCGRSVAGVVEQPAVSEDDALRLPGPLSSSIGDGETWGARLNAHDFGLAIPRAHPAGCPAWVDRPDWHYWDSHGLVVWDNLGHSIGVLHATQALELLEQLIANDDWKTQGIALREHSVRLKIDETKVKATGRKKADSELVPESGAGDSTAEERDHWEERLRLTGQAAAEFFDYLRRNEARLRLVADKDEKKVNHAVMTFWRMAFKHHFVEQLQVVELAGRPLPWMRVEEPPELTCEVLPDKGRIVVHKDGFWWESSIEAPDTAPVYGPFALELVQAMEWVEQTLPKHRAEQVAQEQARAAERAGEAARMAALPRKSLKRYWINPADLELKRITYRAVIQLDYVPFHAKKFELSSGEFIPYDEEFYTPTMLAHEIGLGGAQVDVERPIEFLDWYFVRSATTYHQADVAAAQAQRLWDQSKVLDRFREKKLIRAHYGYQEVETHYGNWLGECAAPDNSWGPPQSRTDYMAEWALRETMVAALDVNGWRKFLQLGFKQRSDEQILRVLHEMRANSHHQSPKAKADSSRWLQDHPEGSEAERPKAEVSRSLTHPQPSTGRSGRRSRTRSGTG